MNASASRCAIPAVGSSSSRRLGSGQQDRGEVDDPPGPRRQLGDAVVAEAVEPERLDHLGHAVALVPLEPPRRRAARGSSPAHRPGSRASAVRRSVSSTESSGKRRQSWKDRTTPIAARSSGRSSSRSRPSTETEPCAGETMPEMTSSSVVFPDPLGPMSPTIDPGSTVRSHVLEGPHPAEVDGDALDDEPGGGHAAVASDARPDPDVVPTRPPDAHGTASATASAAEAGSRGSRRSRQRAIPTATRSPARWSSSAIPPGR